MRFLEIVPNEKIVMDDCTPEPDDPGPLPRHGDLRRAGRRAGRRGPCASSTPLASGVKVVIGFGAVAYGLQTLDGLAAGLDR